MNTIAKLREFLDEERRAFSLLLPENRKTVEIAITRATIARERSAPALLAVAEAAEKFVNSKAFQGVCDEECDIESALTKLNEVQL